MAAPMGILGGGRRGGQIALPRHPGKPEGADGSGAGIGEGNEILIRSGAGEGDAGSTAQGGGTGRNGGNGEEGKQAQKLQKSFHKMTNRSGFGVSFDKVLANENPKAGDRRCGEGGLFPVVRREA